jgi:ribosomal protein S18 acetylase RimI-like enzyme
MQVRPLAPGDAEPAVGLLRELGYGVDADALLQRIASVEAAGDHLLLVAEVDSQVMGLLHAYYRPALETPAETVIQALVVDARRRALGVGRALMDAAADWARSRNSRALSLHTREDRADAQAFYRRLGFTTVATSNLMRRSLT